jgi:hypothetical protein
MHKIIKKLTVETRSGKAVTSEVTVHVSVRSDIGGGPRGNVLRNIKDVDVNVPDRCDDNRILSQDEKNEVEKLVGERIDKERWGSKS